MPIQLNPEAYKFSFSGEILFSRIVPSNDGREIWMQRIAYLTNNNGTYVKTPITQACQYPTCNETQYRHQHQTFYENERPNSPVAQFVFSLRDHAHIALTNPTDLEGKQFEFEEVKHKPGINPATGQLGKERTYYYVIGPVGTQVAEIDEVAELPFDSGSPATNLNLTAAQKDGTGAEDFWTVFAREIDGKSVEETRVHVRNVPEIFDNKIMYIQILDGRAFAQIQEKKLAIADENGVFHRV